MKTNSETPLKKAWAMPELILISTNAIRTGNHAGFKENSVVQLSTTTTLVSGQQFDVFRTTKNGHVHTHTVPVAAGPANNFYAS